MVVYLDPRSVPSDPGVDLLPLIRLAHRCRDFQYCLTFRTRPNPSHGDVWNFKNLVDALHNPYAHQEWHKLCTDNVKALIYRGPMRGGPPNQPLHVQGPVATLEIWIGHLQDPRLRAMALGGHHFNLGLGLSDKQWYITVRDRAGRIIS